MLCYKSDTKLALHLHAGFWYVFVWTFCGKICCKCHTEFYHLQKENSYKHSSVYSLLVVNSMFQSHMITQRCFILISWVTVLTSDRLRDLMLVSDVSFYWRAMNPLITIFTLYFVLICNMINVLHFMSLQDSMKGALMLFEAPFCFKWFITQWAHRWNGRWMLCRKMSMKVFL